jgi:hypothetical protein
MKIIDSIMFLNEYDILEIRLKEMYDHVDKFVIVECNKTHTGIPKEFNLEKHLDRFKPWLDKIDYIKVEQDNPSSHAWNNEYWQRDQMARGWQDLTTDDVILISDADEIIRPEAIDFIRNTNYDLYGLYMPAFYFKFNYMDTNPDFHYKVWGKAYRNPSIGGCKMRYTNEMPGKSRIELHHAGWHFGWLGDDEFVKHKMQCTPHTEINQPHIFNNVNIDKHIAEGRDHFRPENTTWCAVDLDDYFPKTIIENMDQYKQFILPNNGKKVRDFFPQEILENTTT